MNPGGGGIIWVCRTKMGGDDSASVAFTGDLLAGSKLWMNL